MGVAKSLQKNIIILTLAVVGVLIAIGIVTTTHSYASNGVEITKYNGISIDADNTVTEYVYEISGEEFTLTFEAIGENLTWSSTTVDRTDTLEIDPKTGTITGTLNYTARGYIFVRVTDENGDFDELAVQMYMLNSGQLVHVTADMTTTGKVGEKYSGMLVLMGYTNYEYEIVSGQIPDGLSITFDRSPIYMEFTGVPTRAGTYTFEVAFTNYGFSCGDPYEVTIVIEGDPLLRIYGQNRYTTAFKNGDKLKELQGGQNFDTVVVTTGETSPDALSGAYLASKNDAPLLLINRNSAESVREYIQNNLNPGGRIVILGGTNSVEDSWLSDVGEYTIDRIAGATRYETNLKILEEVGYNGGRIFVATGENYADSLSGSALDIPILLVNGNKSLTTNQKEFLTKISGSMEMYIAGGTNSISDNMKTSLEEYGYIITRFAGATRYETSKLIAEAFFPDATQAVLTIGDNFPDGLSVGSVASELNAPILLTNNGAKSNDAYSYTRGNNIRTGIIIGGPGSKMITDETASKVFDNTVIEIYEPDKY